MLINYKYLTIEHFIVLHKVICVLFYNMAYGSNKLSNIDNIPDIGEIILNENLELWMTLLPPYLKTIPIIHLAIPGSHNAMTYTIHRYNEVGPDEPGYLQFLGKYCSFISRPLVYNWSVTQYDNVLQQLNGGIRYLDLRLATKQTDNEIYFLHGLYGDKVTEHLINIDNWLTSHPNEIIIIDCQHFYLFTENHHRNFVRILKNIFGNKICPTTIINLPNITLDWMIKRTYQLIIVYRNDIVRLERDMWPSELWPTPWPNTVRPHQLIDFLDTRLGTRLQQAGFISQCVLTPDTKYVLCHICGSLHRELATLCRHATLSWIENNYPGNGGLNIIITDYVSFNNFLFSKIVIQRNAQLLLGDNSTQSGGYLTNKSINENQPIE